MLIMEILLLRKSKRKKVHFKLNKRKENHFETYYTFHRCP